MFKKRMIAFIVIFMFVMNISVVGENVITMQNDFSLMHINNEIKEIEENLEQMNREMTQILKIYNEIKKCNPKLSNEQVMLIIKTVNITSEKYGIDKAVIYSQIKQESNFDPNLVGRDKDTGLMQILPKTGEEIAKKMGIENYSYKMLFDIEINIEMGVWYLKMLFDRSKYVADKYDERLNVALVSYNAGPSAFTQFKKYKTYENNYYNDVLRHYSNFV